MKAPTRLVILISGHGSNLQAVIDACASGELNAEIVGVVSNKETAYGLTRAQAANIPTLIKTASVEQERYVYDAELATQIRQLNPDLILLAGWMRILSLHFLKHFPNKVLNLHPALPGIYPGVRAIERAWEDYRAGKIQHTGVMVHLVPDEGVDAGPVLGQVRVPIYRQDDLAALQARVHTAERDLLLQVIKNNFNDLTK